MNIISLDFLYTIDPVVALVAAIPVLIALIIWISFYSRYDWKSLGKLSVALQSLTKQSAGMMGYSKENLAAFNEQAPSKKTPEFESAWQRMMNQVQRQYTEDVIPEARTFFEEDALITIPGHRRSIGLIWGSMVVLVALSMIMPLVAEYKLTIQFTVSSIFVGLGAAAFVCVGQMIFTWADQRAYNKALAAYRGFIDAFDTVLPVAGALAGSALLLQATQKNQKTYEKVMNNMVVTFEIETAKITDKFDEFTKGGVLPALTAAVQQITDAHIVPALDGIKTQMDQTIQEIIAKQDSGMQELTDSFAARLADTLEVRIGALAKGLEDTQLQMQGISKQLTEQFKADNKRHEDQLQANNKLYNDQLQANNKLYDDQLLTNNKLYDEQLQANNKFYAEQLQANNKLFVDQMAENNGTFMESMKVMSLQLETNISGLSEMMESQKNTLSQSSGILIRAAELQGEAIENTEMMNKAVAVMTDSISKFEVQTAAFGKEALEFSANNSQTQLKISQEIQASQLKLEESLGASMEKYTQMSKMISDMMENITSRMNEAMEGAGKEIAKGINQVTADNAEAISNLTHQAQNLRDDYDTYFGRIDDTTKKTLEDMDYQMQGLIARLTEEVGTMLKDTVQENASILSQYKDNTTSLLQSFGEQALSISLYAKEISLDISDLSTSLKGSVSEFSEKMQEGVRLTIGEFDQGLAELTDRIANTVASISDAVESIPAALCKK